MVHSIDILKFYWNSFQNMVVVHQGFLKNVFSRWVVTFPLFEFEDFSDKTNQLMLINIKIYTIIRTNSGNIFGFV